MALVGDGRIELLQPCLTRFMPFIGTFLRISPCYASHPALTSSASITGIMWATLVVMVHGTGSKWELEHSSRVSDRGSGIGLLRSVLMN